MINVNEKIKKLEEELDDDAINFADMMQEYSGSAYICDVISEKADSDVDIYTSDLDVDIYTSDLLDWAKDHLGDIEDANAEFGTPNDIIKQIIQAQYKVNYDALYAGMDDGLKLAAWRLAKDHAEEVTEVQAAELDAVDIDNNDRISALADYVDGVFAEDDA